MAYLSLVSGAEVCRHARCSCSKTRAAQAVEMIAARDKHWIAMPPRSGILQNTNVPVPAPRFGCQYKTMPGIAKLELQLASNGRGDTVICYRRVTIVADAN